MLLERLPAIVKNNRICRKACGIRFAGVFVNKMGNKIITNRYSPLNKGMDMISMSIARSKANRFNVLLAYKDAGSSFLINGSCFKE